MSANPTAPAYEVALRAARLLYESYGYGMTLDVQLRHNDRTLPSMHATLRVTKHNVSITVDVDRGDDPVELAAMIERKLKGAR